MTKEEPTYTVQITAEDAEGSETRSFKGIPESGVQSMRDAARMAKPADCTLDIRVILEK